MKQHVNKKAFFSFADSLSKAFQRKKRKAGFKTKRVWHQAIAHPFCIVYYWRIKSGPAKVDTTMPIYRQWNKPVSQRHKTNYGI